MSLADIGAINAIQAGLDMALDMELSRIDQNGGKTCEWCERYFYLEDSFPSCKNVRYGRHSHVCWNCLYFNDVLNYTDAIRVAKVCTLDFSVRDVLEAIEDEKIKEIANASGI